MTRGRTAAIATLAIVLAGCETGGTDGDELVDAALADAAPLDAALAEVVTFVALPGATGSIGFDDIRFDPALGRVVLPARALGDVLLIAPDTLDVRVVHAGGDVGSADARADVVVAVDRARATAIELDPSTGATLREASAAAFVDYARIAPFASEIWATEPDASAIEVLAMGSASEPAASLASISFGTGFPEGLAFDPTRGRAYSLDEGSGELVVIDTSTRSVVSRWSLGCSGVHGIPAVDEARGFVLAGCSSAELVVFDAHDGTVTGRFSLGGGASLVAYSASRRHAYLRGDPGGEVVILALDDAGAPSELGRVAVPTRGHCLVADDRGNVWTADASGGRAVRIRDTL